MITLTERAVTKVKEVIAAQAGLDEISGLRVSVVGGGCSGFQYAMNLEKGEGDGDQVLQFEGFKVFVDEHSGVYLNGTEIDFVETSQGAGFKFNNPNVKSTCGCGESFQT